MIPAEFTSTSSTPQCAAVSSTSVAAAAGSRRSAPIANASPPARADRLGHFVRAVRGLVDNARRPARRSARAPARSRGRRGGPRRLRARRGPGIHAATIRHADTCAPPSVLQLRPTRGHLQRAEHPRSFLAPCQSDPPLATSPRCAASAPRRATSSAEWLGWRTSTPSSPSRLKRLETRARPIRPGMRHDRHSAALVDQPIASRTDRRCFGTFAGRPAPR